MQKEEISEIMKEYGFVPRYELKGNSENNGFVFECVPDGRKCGRWSVPPYFCTVYEDGAFSCDYMVAGKGPNILQMPKASPITNKDLFERLVAQFEIQIAVLNHFCNV